MAKRNAPSPDSLVPAAEYDGLLGEVVVLLESARRTAARAVNAAMTATYWEIGRRIVEVEQRGRERAAYGSQLIERLASVEALWTGVLQAQSGANAAVLPRLANCADSVCAIRGGDFAHSVGEIGRADGVDSTDTDCRIGDRESADAVCGIAP